MWSPYLRSTYVCTRVGEGSEVWEEVGKKDAEYGFENIFTSSKRPAGG